MERRHLAWLSLGLVVAAACGGSEDAGNPVSHPGDSGDLGSDAPIAPQDAAPPDSAVSDAGSSPDQSVQDAAAPDSNISDALSEPDHVLESECLARPLKSVIDGTHTAQYSGTPVSGETVDARGATWTLVNGWLATPKASVDVCWVGGTFELTFDDTALSPTAAWADIWHHNGGWTLKNGNSGWIFDGVTVRHVGDAFNVSQTGQDFTIRHSHVSDVRDDCVQNDEMYAGLVHDNFFDGCYVGFSARASGTAADGHLNTWVIRDNLVWIKPTYSVYKGDSPGNGQIVKWEKAMPQNAPKLVFRNNFVRVGKTPFQVGDDASEAFFFPATTDFSDNILYWDGPGTAPSSLEAWFNQAHNSKIVYTSDEWDAAVSDWWLAHPDVE